jgi:hypothetical protein
MQLNQQRGDLRTYHIATKFGAPMEFVGQVFKCEPKNPIGGTCDLKSGSIFGCPAKLCQIVQQAMRPIISTEERRRFKTQNITFQRFVPFPGMNLARWNEN